MWTLIYFLLLIGILVTIHELGHFLVARVMGVKVITFSFGFGPKLFRLKGRETEYCISLFPLGGYVKMLGDDPSEEVSEADKFKSFNYQPLWKRFLIVLAGPVSNLILPFIVFFIIFLSTSELQPSMLGTVIKDGPAWKGGLRAGDRITAVDGKSISYWWELLDKVSNSPGKEINITYERSGSENSIRIIPESVENVMIKELDLSEKVGRIQIVPFYMKPVIFVMPGSVAEQAGMQKWDLVTSVNGKTIRRWDELENILQNWKQGDLEFELKKRKQTAGSIKKNGQSSRSEEISDDDFGEIYRAGIAYQSLSSTGIRNAEMFVFSTTDSTPAKDQIELQQGDEILTLDGKEYTLWSMMTDSMNRNPYTEHILKFRRGDTEIEKRFMLKIMEEKDPTGKMVLVPVFGARNISFYELPDPVPNVNRFAYAVVNTISETLNAYIVNALSIAYLIAGKLSFKELGGPILIADMAGRTREKGWIYFFKIMIWISTGFGFINLVPIPVLDGGHLLLFVIEAVRRKPLSVKTRQIVTYIGVAILVLLMLIVFKNDIERKWDELSAFFSSLL
jgi:regulator of sigma E protease